MYRVLKAKLIRNVLEGLEQKLKINATKNVVPNSYIEITLVR